MASLPYMTEAEMRASEEAVRRSLRVLEATERKMSTATLFDLGAAEGWLPAEGEAA